MELEQALADYVGLSDSFGGIFSVYRETPGIIRGDTPSFVIYAFDFSVPGIRSVYDRMSNMKEFDHDDTSFSLSAVHSKHNFGFLTYFQRVFQ